MNHASIESFEARASRIRRAKADAAPAADLAAMARRGRSKPGTAEGLRARMHGLRWILAALVTVLMLGTITDLLVGTIESPAMLGHQIATWLTLLGAHRSRPAGRRGFEEIARIPVLFDFTAIDAAENPNAAQQAPEAPAKTTAAAPEVPEQLASAASLQDMPGWLETLRPAWLTDGNGRPAVQ